MPIYRVVLPLLLLILAGCATQIRNSSVLAFHVDQLISEHHYGAALLSIDEFAARNADVEQLSRLRHRVANAATGYESTTIDAARTRVAQGDWHAAQLIYRKARYRFPESVVLGAAETDFTTRRDLHVEHLRIDQYAEKASYLNAEIAQLEQINAATPFNLYTKRELAHRKEEQALIAKALLKAGERQMEAENYVAAKRYLTLSNKLMVSATAENALRQIPRPVEQQPIKGKPETQLAVVKIAEPALITRLDSNIDIDVELAHVMKAYYSAREQGDLLVAQYQLRQAKRLQPYSADLAIEQQALLTVVQEYVQEKLENGKYLYSTGDVDAAIAVWQIATTLDPDNPAIQQRLQRAQKFRQNYEELKK